MFSHRSTRRHDVVAAVYLVLSLAGLVATWSFNLAYRGGDYLGDWFANPASSSAAADIITVLVVSFVLYFTEGRRVGLPWWFLLLLVPLSVGGAVACALPLFLAARELRLARTSGAGPRADSSPTG